MRSHAAPNGGVVQRLIVNARIATGDPRRPWADAMLVDGNRVIAIGSSAALRKRAPEAEVVDANGGAVQPDGAPFVTHEDVASE